MLKELGFNINRFNDVFRLNINSKESINPEDLVVFSPEEVSIINNAVLNCGSEGPLHKSLMDKLYALSDLDEMAETLYKQSVARNISIIRNAIKKQKQVILRSYHSSNRRVDSDRLVEPIKFFYYYRYILAYEVKTKEVKQYKTERIKDVELTDISFKHEDCHEQKKVDVFGISGTKPIKVKLRLSRRAASLLCEELPDSELFIKVKNEDKFFEGHVFGFEGVGRFVMGLPGEVKVIEPIELIEFIQARINRYNSYNYKNQLRR